ncbi:MAG TPA: exodeoxyribonuclease VII large subunit [Thermoanaerobaculia bacterium]|nr:exodeoxyribonuclease VII large subunit [Thermoanaerobaculia bacterium]
MSSRYGSGRFVPRRVPSRVGETASLFGGTPEERAVTVSLFVAQLNNTLRASLPDTWVKGEVGEWRVYPSGHAYFSLKDESATMRAIMWGSDVARLPFRVEPGMSLLARGRPDVYARSGVLSFVVSELQPVGAGALQLAFEQLKARLQAEGLFDLARKRPLPLLPRRIGTVTSRHGAALRDILKVLHARFPNAHVTIYPVLVQGSGAAEGIARAIRAFSRLLGADVLIVARGGGSKDDLAVFNDERVIRAVAASLIPTISAVGHEVDVTLTDLAADVRAATPSHAAELVVAQRYDFEGRLDGHVSSLLSALESHLQEARADLMGRLGATAFSGFPERVRSLARETADASRSLRASVTNLPAVFGERLSRAEGRLWSWPEAAALPERAKEIASEKRLLVERMEARVAGAREKLGALAGPLSALDPLRVLARGYAVAYRKDDPAPLTDASRLSPGDDVKVLLARGEVTARVTAVDSSVDRRRRGEEK